MAFQSTHPARGATPYMLKNRSAALLREADNKLDLYFCRFSAESSCDDGQVLRSSQVRGELKE